MKLFYRKEGEGPVIVIIHGLYGSSDNWMSIGKRLAENYTVFLIDQRNHGRSPFADRNSYNDMKSDLQEFFESQKINKATLLGHSMGGKTAMWFAADYPEKVEKMVIADIAPKDYIKMNEQGPLRIHRNILLAMKDVDFNLVKKRNDVDDFLSGKIRDFQVRKFLLKNVVKDKKTKRFKWRLNVEVLIEYIEEIVGGVNRDWFEGRIPITVYPVIFIRGMNSNYILPEDEHLLKEIYPDSSIVNVPEAGHWLHAENPEKFMEAVLRCC